MRRSQERSDRKYRYEPDPRLYQSSSALFRWMAEPIRGDGSNKDGSLVMGIPGPWMVVLHPLHRIFRTEDFRRAPDEACSSLSNGAGVCRQPLVLLRLAFGLALGALGLSAFRLLARLFTLNRRILLPSDSWSCTRRPLFQTTRLPADSLVSFRPIELSVQRHWSAVAVLFEPPAHRAQPAVRVADLIEDHPADRGIAASRGR